MRSRVPHVDSIADETTPFLACADTTWFPGSARRDSLASIGDLPRNFGRYRIQGQLGRGGMGSVYLAEDTQLDRMVALKTPSTSNDVKERVVHRFYREARAAAAINHPNVCAIFDVGEMLGRLYFTMAYHRGCTLAKWLNTFGPIKATTVLPIVRKLASGLRAVHGAGIVHRDLKPSNVMMTPGGEPVIIDFGIVRQLGAAESKQAISSMSVGTPAYMAPELITGRAKCTPAVDIFSLGVILYELLTGSAPFSGSLATLMGTIVRDEPPAPTALHAALDPKLGRPLPPGVGKRPGEPVFFS